MFKFVSVFSTNISSEADRDNIIQELVAHESILSVHVDLEDTDKILRVESTGNPVSFVKKYMYGRSMICDELQSFDVGMSF